MIRLSRRRLLLGGAAGAGLAAATVGSQVLPLGADQRIKQLIRTQLDYLQISDEVLDAFLRDYKADPLYSRYQEFRRRSYGVRNAAHRLRILDGWQAAERRERQIVAQFLLSTDFFREGADMNRPVSYWRYSDPYGVGCANQFATLS